MTQAVADKLAQVSLNEAARFVADQHAKGCQHQFTSMDDKLDALQKDMSQTRIDLTQLKVEMAVMKTKLTQWAAVAAGIPTIVLLLIELVRYLMNR